jgi:hypothetical protein
MEIEFSLEEEDLFAFEEYNVRGGVTPQSRRREWVVWGLILLSYLGLVLYHVCESESHQLRLNPKVLVLMGVVGLCMVFLATFCRRPFIRLYIRRMLRRPGNAILLASRRVRITAVGLSELNEFGGTRNEPWRTIVRIDSTGDHAFVFTTESTAFVIPRRAFASEGDFRTFVETAQQFHGQAGQQRFSDARPSPAPHQVSENPPPPSGRTDLTAGAGGEPHGD